MSAFVRSEVLPKSREVRVPSNFVPYFTTTDNQREDATFEERKIVGTLFTVEHTLFVI